jgi:hypothetical protein
MHTSTDCHEHLPILHVIIYSFGGPTLWDETLELSHTAIFVGKSACGGAPCRVALRIRS